MKASLILIFFTLTITLNAQIWVNTITSGRPIATYYQGDKLAIPWFFNFEIGQTSWNTSEVGIGQNTDGVTNWNWAAATYYEDGDGSNKRVRRDIGDFQFINTGTWFVVGRAKADALDAWSYADEGGWTNNTSLLASTTEGSCPYFSVSALENPTSISSTAASNFQINLSWTKWNSKDVLIVRRLTSSEASNPPVQGTAYSVNDALGTGTVVYKGSGTSYEDTGLTPGTDYTYILYSENFSYYSAGISDAESTTAVSASTDHFRSNGSANWHVAGSWQSSTDGSTNWITATLVPNATAASITIRDGHNITLNDNATIGSITIESGATLTASDATSRTLTLSGGGTLTNNGTFTAATGTVVFSGSGAVAGSTATSFNNVQIAGGVVLNGNSTISNKLTINSGGYLSETVGGDGIDSDGEIPSYGSNATLAFTGTFNINDLASGWGTSSNKFPKNLSVEGTGNLTLSLARSITGNVDIATGATLASNGNLTLISTGSGTASLLNLGTVTGNVTVQRYIPGATWTNWKDGWHALSSPVSAQDISPNFVIDPAADYDFYTWYEPNNIWVNFKNTSNAPTWNTANTIDNNLTNDAAEFLVGKGYLVAYKTTDTKVFTGTLNSDDVVISNLDITDTEATKSFHLLGNPFASALQWNADWTKTNIAATIQVWSELLQDYSALEYGSYIPAMNGFMVEVTADDASITIPKLEREHNSTAWYKSLDNQSLKLTVMDQDNVSGKETMIRFNPASTTGFDVDFDGSYLQGYGPVFYSLSEDNKLSVNTLPTATNDLTIPIVFSKNDAEIFWLQASGVESMPYTVYLTDTKLNYTQNLQSNPYYSFTSAEGDDPNRFLLHFGAVGVDEAIPAAAVAAYVSNNILYVLNAQGKVQVDVMDISGRLVHSQSLQANGLSSTPLSLPAGVYVVRLNDGQTSRTNKVIVQ